MEGLLKDYRRALKEIESSIAYFQRASKAATLLGYLAEQKHKGETASMEALRERLFRRDSLPQDGGVNAVRTLVYRVRSELRNYFLTNPIGIAAEYMLDIRQANGAYELISLPNLKTCESMNPFDWFWVSYLRSKGDPIIQTCARVFLAFGDNIYFRDVSKHQGGEIDDLLNWLGTSRDKVNQKLADKTNWRKSRHFVSAGETAGMLHLTDAFWNRNRRIRFGNLPQYGKSRGDANVIQVGLPRNDDRTIYNLIQSEYFYLTPTGVNKRDNHSETVTHQDGCFQRSPDDFFDDKVAVADRYVILTRLPNSDPRYSLTAITSNHGRATEAVCKFLSDDTRMATLMQCLTRSCGVPPPKFQVLFKVRLVRQGEREIEKETAIVSARSASSLETDQPSAVEEAVLIPAQSQ